MSVRQMMKEIQDFYHGRKCLVTGHTGFKGSWLSLWLHMLSAEVTGYALDPPTSPALSEVTDLRTVLNDFRGDIREFHKISEVIQLVQPSVVFHLAAQSIVRESYVDPKYTFDTNVGGVVNILEACRSCPSVKIVVVVTSDKCYENSEWHYAYRENDPLCGYDPYSSSKAAAEMVCLGYRRSFFDAAGVSLVTARAGNTIGGGDWATDRLVPDAIRALNAGIPIPVRNPRSIRPWQHVLDPLFGYLLLACRLENQALSVRDGSMHSSAWNFGPDVRSCRSVKELVEEFVRVYGEGEWEDCSAMHVDAPHEAGILSLANNKAYHSLGWTPLWDFGQAVNKTVEWYQEFERGYDPRDLCNKQIKEYTANL